MREYVQSRVPASHGRRLCNVYYMPILKSRNRLLPLALAFCAGLASSATPPYIQLVPAAVSPGTCASGGPTPQIAANIDLAAAGLYRYSPAYVLAQFFDDEGEFNVVWNQDATLLVSNYVRVDGTQVRMPLPLAPLATWYSGFGRLPEHTTLALRAAAYDASGRAVATSRITWDCTTGALLTVEHLGNAAAPIEARLVEYYHANLDHYFVTADVAEIAKLDAGQTSGWQRTGESMKVAASPYETAVAVCRFYLPPDSCDSHFYSASAAECDDVHARFPAFVRESDSVFAAALPDVATGMCASGFPVYRLWNARVDTNHRYTTSAAIKAAMIGRGYIAEGYGVDGVALCTLP
jgi:hypothetical protein